ncbi:MAG: bifunctional 4-hydroxy-2-oxoglutarate aldolase/2-dehydro-3-deoxy-phosphogluconate aldolase [Eubacteriales bacterium]|nr:bifunctional 4-hydroxy-2-oxoglutarate aldolase/2-dehydro-3-deoxy-phosphogluconate aldolase [Eubacteriales bacterium]
MQVADQIQTYGIVPVISIPDVALAEPLALALRNGGLPLIEVTLRSDAALESIRAIKIAYPDMLVGAGTVLSIQQVDAAMEAGVDFVVSPGLNPSVVKHCQAKNMPVFPGCATPSEIETALSLGLKVLKFFPAEKMGGMGMVRELCGPYRNVKLIATSGMTLQNLPEYLSDDHIVAIGGSFMAPTALVKERAFSAITALCKQAVRQSMGFMLKHVGVNTAGAEEAETMARQFAEIFALPYLAGGRSDFSGTITEFCKVRFPGAAGHIGIGTYNVARAKAYLEAKGVAFRDEFMHTDANGTPDCVYLAQEFAGFAVHIVKR